MMSRWKNVKISCNIDQITDQWLMFTECITKRNWKLCPMSSFSMLYQWCMLYQFFCLYPTDSTCWPQTGLLFDLHQTSPLIVRQYNLPWLCVTVFCFINRYQEKKVKCMVQRGDKNAFQWPEKDDCIYYSQSDMVGAISEPEPYSLGVPILPVALHLHFASKSVWPSCLSKPFLLSPQIGGQWKSSISKGNDAVV